MDAEKDYYPANVITDPAIFGNNNPALSWGCDAQAAGKQKIVDDQQHGGNQRSTLQQPPEFRNVLRGPPPAGTDLRTTPTDESMILEKKTCQ